MLIRRILKSLILIFLWSSLPAHAAITSGQGVSNIVIPGGEKLEAILGSAYAADKEVFLGDRCLAPKADAVYAGQATSQFTFSQSIDQKTLASHLGFGEEGRGQYGAVSMSEAANFMSNSMSDELSISAVWISSYVFPSVKVIDPSLTTVGQRVSENYERWTATCGDQYVNEITSGGKLFFSIRIQFASATEKNEFSAQFSLSGPLAGVSTSLTQASTEFSRHIKIYVDVYQIGGDVSKLTGVLSGSTETLQKCELGDFDKCAETITNALKYASDTKEGFPSQLAIGATPGPVPLEYKTAPYTAVGIYPTNYPGLEKATLLARNEISDAFQSNYKDSIQVARLLKVDQPALRAKLIAGEKVKIDKNIVVLLDASKVCYNEPQKCFQNWNTKKPDLLAIDDSLLQPESFLTLCKDAAVLDENDPLRLTIEAIKRALAVVGDVNHDPSCEETQFKLSRQISLRLVADPTNPISDLRPLAAMIRLQSLNISNSDIANLNPLSNLVRLKALVLTHNWIEDLSAISDLKNLVTLDLSHNRIKEISPLIGLHNLQILDLSSNLIVDLKIDGVYYPHLYELNLLDNPLQTSFQERLEKLLSSFTNVIWPTNSINGVN